MAAVCGGPRGGAPGDPLPAPPASRRLPSGGVGLEGSHGRRSQPTGLTLLRATFIQRFFSPFLKRAEGQVAGGKGALSLVHFLITLNKSVL